jgi:hypothetical protein
MQKIAKVYNWLGVVVTVGVFATGFLSVYRISAMLISYEPIILLVPFGAALMSLSYTDNKWFSRVAFFTNGLLCVFGIIVLLGEFLWRMLGPVFSGAVLLLVVAPGVLNCVTISRLRLVKLSDYKSL